MMRSHTQQQQAKSCRPVCVCMWGGGLGLISPAPETLHRLCVPLLPVLVSSPDWFVTNLSFLLM